MNVCKTFGTIIMWWLPIGSIPTLSTDIFNFIWYAMPTSVEQFDSKSDGYQFESDAYYYV